LQSGTGIVKKAQATSDGVYYFVETADIEFLLSESELQ
jgi:hypothetical protein